MARRCEQDAEVRIGSVVRIRSCDTMEQELRIVGTNGEQDLHRLSIHTALGRSLLGGRVGEVVQVMTEAGTAEFTIVGIQGAAKSMKSSFVIPGTVLNG
jgi:transcription elongation GreA/GreB family factor